MPWPNYSLNHNLPRMPLKIDPLFVKAALVVLAVFGFIILYVIEFDHFNLMINARQMIIPAVLTFGFAGLLAAYFIQRPYSDLVAKTRIIAAGLLFGILIAPFFMSVTNRMLSFSEPNYVNVEFASLVPFYSSRLGTMKNETLEPTGFYLFFYYNNELIRVTLKEELPFIPEEGDQMLLPLHRGFWGTDFIVPEELASQLLLK